MRTIFKRTIAYIADLLLIMFVASILSNISFINPQVDNYNKYYKMQQTEFTNYQNYVVDLNNYYKDNKITSKEYDKLIKKYPKYEGKLKSYYEDNKISKKEYTKLYNNATKDYQKKYNKLYYYINKYSVAYNIWLIVLMFGYFVGFNIFNKGQTLGKKLLKIRIDNINGDKVRVIDYIIRVVILYNPIYYLMMIIGPYIFNVNSFYEWAMIWGNIKNYLFIIILAVIIIRKDNRGLHDLLSKTVVKREEIKPKKEEEVSVIKNSKVKKNKRGKKIVIDEDKVKED